MTCVCECRVQKKKKKVGADGGLATLYVFALFHYTCLSRFETPPSTPLFIISTGSSRLCLPSSADHRNSRGPATPPSHFNVSLAYSRRSWLRFRYPTSITPAPLSSDLLRSQWLPGRGTEQQQQQKGRWSGFVGVFIVLFLSAPSVFIYDIPSMTGATK